MAMVTPPPPQDPKPPKKDDDCFCKEIIEQKNKESETKLALAKINHKTNNCNPNCDAQSHELRIIKDSIKQERIMQQNHNFRDCEWNLEHIQEVSSPDKLSSIGNIGIEKNQATNPSVLDRITPSTTETVVAGGLCLAKCALDVVCEKNFNKDFCTICSEIKQSAEGVVKEQMGKAYDAIFQSDLEAESKDGK